MKKLSRKEHLAACTGAGILGLSVAGCASSTTPETLELLLFEQNGQP